MLDDKNHPKHNVYSRKLPCKCRDCGNRRSLKRKPDEYIRPPKCNSCGSNRWRVDWYRITNPDSSSGGKVCKLDCLPHPHRVNTKGCREYEDHILSSFSKKRRTYYAEDSKEAPF